MKRIHGILIGLLLVGSLGTAYLAGQVDAQNKLVTADEINTVEIVRKSLPAVARIDVQLKKEVLNPGDMALEVGTGFFVRKDLLVTNYHVVRDQESINVILHNGKSVKAKIEAIDPGIDIALLKIRGVSAPKTLKFGDGKALTQGQKAILLGTPLRFQNYVTTGVFSAYTSPRNVPRDDGLGEEIGQYVLTSAAIQGGNSGGPLLDSRGGVIAVANANASNTPNMTVPGIIGIAIPGDLVKQSVDDLIRHGVSQRGTLGITMKDLDALDPALLKLAGLTSSDGAVVYDVPAGTAGAKAALRGSVRNSRGLLLVFGDVITAVNNKRVRNSFDVIRTVAAQRPGSTITLQVWRKKKKVNVKVKLQRRTNR